ncbi:MAG: hypothetical protein V7607_2632 [Solirubrobacteraceae bacterium]
MAVLATFHLSDTAITALAGVGGALVGAVAGGLVDYVLERRRETTQGRAAARLLRMELAVLKEQMESAVQELQWWPFYDFSMQPWDRYRDLLAALLGADRWLLVSQSAMELQGFGAWVLKAPAAQSADNQPFAISEPMALGLLTMRENAVKAYNALGPLAEEAEEMSGADPPAPGSKPYLTPGS